MRNAFMSPLSSKRYASKQIERMPRQETIGHTKITAILKRTKNWLTTDTKLN